MSGFRLVTEASRIPVPGGKLIEEMFGRVNTGTDRFSLARMVAPPRWSEAEQQPEFGELTIMLRGTMRVEVGGQPVDVGAGQAIWIEPRQRVRYSNPFDEESEYYAVCIPAFSVESAGRRDG